MKRTQCDGFVRVERADAYGERCQAVERRPAAQPADMTHAEPLLWREPSAAREMCFVSGPPALAMPVISIIGALNAAHPGHPAPDAPRRVGRLSMHSADARHR